MNPKTVHLWWADCRNLELPALNDTDHWLTCDEQAALAQKITQVRSQALAAKIFLKSLLADYLRRAPNSLVFHNNACGKPSLVNADLHFNLSHSGHYLVVVLCVGYEVGVDVQCVRHRLAALQIAARFFHPKEYQWLKSLPPAAQQNQFYRLWAAKEALLKARGVGIGASGLKDVVLQLGVKDALHIDKHASAVGFEAYRLSEFFHLPDCALSVAQHEDCTDLQTFQWQGKLDRGTSESIMM